jgi:hypothetical protein
MKWHWGHFEWGLMMDWVVRCLSLASRNAWRCAWTCVLVCLTPSLVGCDQLGIETPQKSAERQEADAKAIGSACRHALRAIEDCYTLNPKANKAAVFAGWREMDEYMRENKLEGVAPVVPRPAPGASKPVAKKADDEEDDVAPEDKGGKTSEKGQSSPRH